MRRIRLLPIVVFAAAALLLLKGVGLITEGGYTLTGISNVLAQATAMPADGTPAKAPELTPSEAAAADRASEALFSQAPAPAVNSTELDAVPYEANKAGEKVPLAAPDGVSDTERAVLERLSDRRAELDQLQAQLNQREELVKAAEARLDERVAGLKELEAQINAQVDEKKTLDDAQFKGLVSMYEVMKPKDAAAIFDQLSTDVLLRVARAMNPRKMSPVMAAMKPARAQELTVLLATETTEPQMDKPLGDVSSLPQIIGQ